MEKSQGQQTGCPGPELQLGDLGGGHTDPASTSCLGPELCTGSLEILESLALRPVCVRASEPFLYRA